MLFPPLAGFAGARPIRRMRELCGLWLQRIERFQYDTYYILLIHFPLLSSRSLPWKPVRVAYIQTPSLMCYDHASRTVAVT